MHIALLSRNRNLYSSRRLVEAAEQRGHTLRVIDTLRCYMSIAAHHPSIHLKGKSSSPSMRSFPASAPRSPSTAARCCASSR